VPELITGGAGDPEDRGGADPRVAAALAAFAAGQEGEHAVLAALATARLLVPVVAVLAEAAGDERVGAVADDEQAGAAITGKAGRRGRLRREKVSEMALPTLVGKDGRRAVLAFTCLEAMARWRPDARPVPVPATRVWLAARHETGAAVIDVAGPVPLAVDGMRLAALAAGRPVPLPQDDPDVRAAAQEAFAGEPAITDARLAEPRAGSDVSVHVTLAASAGPAQATDAIQRAVSNFVAATGGRFRRGVEVSVAGSGLAAGPS
jgi:type III secretion system (T3SS) SseB-like protein